MMLQLPITPSEIAHSAIEAVQAAAAILNRHVHELVRTQIRSLVCS